MKKRFLILVLLALFALGAAVPPFTTIFMRTVLDDEDAATARTTLAVGDHEFQPLHLAERTSDPAKPAEGEMILWMTDGTDHGDDGDLMVAAQAGGTVKLGTLWDFSAASEWIDFLLLETGDALLKEDGDKVILE